MHAIGKQMHIGRTYEVTVSRESAGTADPISTIGLLFMPTARTPATGSSFGAGEAQDVSLFGFVGEIVVFPVFPQGHAPFGRLLQGIPGGPLRVGCARRFVQFHTEVPDLRRFLLRAFQSAKLAFREICQPIDTDSLHR